MAIIQYEASIITVALFSSSNSNPGCRGMHRPSHHYPAIQDVQPGSLQNTKNPGKCNFPKVPFSIFQVQFFSNQIDWSPWSPIW